MIFIILAQIMVLDGGKIEEDINNVCSEKFKEFSGSFPDEIFANGFNFDLISYFKIENLKKFEKSVFFKAIDNRFVRIAKVDDIEVYIEPESRMKFDVDTLTLNFFTRYFVVKYLKDYACVYSFRPKKGEK